MSTPSQASKAGRVWAVAAIIALLSAFAVLAITAAADKSPTNDEPLHLVGGFLHRYENDFRINPEDPPLLGLLATLPLPQNAIRLNTADPNYDLSVLDIRNQWDFVGKALFKDTKDAGGVVAQSRLAFVSVGILLGALIALAAWMLAGPWAAVAAVAIYALDPNFLAHTAIIKNDVPLSFALFALTLAIWRAGIRGTWYWLAAIAIAVGAAMNVKFSGLLAGPIFALALGARALLSEPWNIIGLTLRTRMARLIAVAALCLGVAAVAWTITWAAYGFRYAATNDGELLNTPEQVRLTQTNQYVAAAGHGPIEDAVLDGKPFKLPADAPTKLNLPARIAVWLQDAHLMPQAWAFGFLYTYSTTLVRRSYLLGKISLTGFRLYFPIAMLLKTPLATLAGVAGAALLLIGWAVRRAIGRRSDASTVAGGTWSAIAWTVTPLVYMAAALTTNLNMGLRHVLPVYPFLFLAVGIAAASVVRWKRSLGVAVISLLVLGLAAENFIRYPDYLAFFNVAAGGPRDWRYLLGDSNLDWGQDLPALAEWQRAHPGVVLYLCYNGSANPAYYGIHTTMPVGKPPSPLTYPRQGVLAVSASMLQGTYVSRGFVKCLGLHGPAFEVLHGTIYLYRVP